MMKNVRALLAGAAFALIVAAPAQAAPLLFSYQSSPTAKGMFMGSFTIDSNPVPSSIGEKGFFQLSNVAGVYTSGAVPTNTAANIDFFLTDAVAQSGGFELDVPGGNAFLFEAGPQLFSGTLAAPVFQTGIFTLARGTVVTIAAVPGAVPEPAAWGMMILGMGAIGAAMRRRQKVTVRFA